MHPRVQHLSEWLWENDVDLREIDWQDFREGLWGTEV